MVGEADELPHSRRLRNLLKVGAQTQQGLTVHPRH